MRGHTAHQGARDSAKILALKTTRGPAKAVLCAGELACEVIQEAQMGEAGIDPLQVALCQTVKALELLASLSHCL